MPCMTIADSLKQQSIAKKITSLTLTTTDLVFLATAGAARTAKAATTIMLSETKNKSGGHNTQCVKDGCSVM